MIEIIFFAIFAAAASYAFLAVWRKIPLLLQVPPRLIEESFLTRPPRLKRYSDPVLIFFRERRHTELYYAVLARFLHWLRLTLLRFERVVHRAIQGLEARDRKLSAAEERYWSQLKQWKSDGKKNGNHIPKAVLTEAAPAELTERSSSGEDQAV